MINWKSITPATEKKMNEIIDAISKNGNYYPPDDNVNTHAITTLFKLDVVDYFRYSPNGSYLIIKGTKFHEFVFYHPIDYIRKKQLKEHPNWIQKGMNLTKHYGWFVTLVVEAFRALLSK
ncbi:hypothetical protein ML462_07370 [Gramella lutea]|uniref:Uncharacterized protein n=1 Tax=Christiangramia lutea TaxID=1607951 RepID=A0A9X1V2R3_9FLAO|nr:hypothetical protein [Christiangramia lutea]MCH4822991.1 hypothetical protein [Christiangramia lutea]